MEKNQKSLGEIFTKSKLDLTRDVKYKARHAKPNEFVPKDIRKNRTYDDFLKFIESNPGINYIEMDTVIGRTGGKFIVQ